MTGEFLTDHRSGPVKKIPFRWHLTDRLTSPVTGEYLTDHQSGPVKKNPIPVAFDRPTDNPVEILAATGSLRQGCAYPRKLVLGSLEWEHTSFILKTFTLHGYYNQTFYSKPTHTDLNKVGQHNITHTQPREREYTHTHTHMLYD